ncbi:MAG: helix-turn-helix domain-containing protein [Propionibacteriaceae bacterium]|nr:helix-turn-helix domain-containing protein [Propionibacteriaceae bacterium]
MDMETKRALLAEARIATEALRAAEAELSRLAAVRRSSIQACMDAGIPRQEIAEALGVHRNVIYQILSRG